MLNETDHLIQEPSLDNPYNYQHALKMVGDVNNTTYITSNENISHFSDTKNLGFQNSLDYGDGGGGVAEISQPDAS